MLPFLFLDIKEKLSSLYKIQNQKKFLIILETIVQINYKWMLDFS